MTKTEFLLARIAEDEAVAKRIRSDQIHALSGNRLFNPRRALAECEAKRRIVEADAEADQVAGGVGGGSFTYEAGRSDGLDIAIRALAAVYSDHPDYDPAWA